MTQLTSILDRCEAAFKQAKKNWLVGISLLFEIKATEVWKDRAGSWSEYVESNLGLNRSQTETHLSVYEYYVVKGHLSPLRLEAVEPYRARMAMNLKGTPELQLSKALTLTRREMKESKNDEEPCDHTNQGLICFDCHIRL